MAQISARLRENAVGTRQALSKLDQYDSTVTPLSCVFTLLHRSPISVHPVGAPLKYQPLEGSGSVHISANS